jgi:hypothetical protein
MIVNQDRNPGIISNIRRRKRDSGFWFCNISVTVEPFEEVWLLRE